MKIKLRKPVSFLASLVLILGMSTTAFAADIDIPSDTSDNKPIEVSAAEFDESTAVLLDRVVVEYTPEDGIMPYDNTYSGDDSRVTYVLNFVVDKNGTYYVRLSAEIAETNQFTKNILQIRPKNGDEWYKHEKSVKCNSYEDEMYFSYPDGAPDNVYVDVKYSYRCKDGGTFFPAAIRLDDADPI